MSSGVIQYEVRPTQLADLDGLLPLRQADVDEITAQGRDPKEALYDSYEASHPHVFTILVDGRPAAIFGAGLLRTFGVPWMLGNEDMLRIPAKAVIQKGRRWIEYLNAIYPHLENWVDARNHVSIRWLEAMGFEFPGETVEFPGGFFFRRFTRDV